MGRNLRFFSLPVAGAIVFRSLTFWVRRQEVARGSGSAGFQTTPENQARNWQGKTIP
jgi:hypothetical protein